MVMSGRCSSLLLAYHAHISGSPVSITTSSSNRTPAARAASKPARSVSRLANPPLVRRPHLGPLEFTPRRVLAARAPRALPGRHHDRAPTRAISVPSLSASSSRANAKPQTALSATLRASLRRFCKLNNDSRYDTCEAPQEIDNDEIDILLKAQQDAEEQGRGETMVPGGLPSGARGSSWNKKDKTTNKTPSGVNDNVWHRIHRNIFTHREPKSVTEDDVLICSCVPDPVSGVGCGDECINRDVLVECDPNFCPCGSKCLNQKFQSKKYAKLDIRRTGKKGHGLFTKQSLRKGEFIIEYVGEVLHEDEYRARKNRYEAEEKRHYYFMTLSSSETIDAAERGNAGRFLNHSCAPNCETQKWMVNGELCIGIYALEDIAPDEELTFDYNFERYGDNPIKCYCGTKKCGGWIGGGQKDGDDTDVPSALAAAEDDDPEDYYEPAPVMLEADEAEIAEEETRGREARVRARLSNRRGGASDPFKPKDVYGNDDDDYDGDGEIAAAKKEAQREANRAAREANRAAGRSSSGNLRRSGSSSLGVSRKSSAGSFKRVNSSGYVPSYYGAPSTAKRRSEVDVSMERLRGASGALRNAKAAVKCVRLFNLAYPVTAAGTQSVSQRDLGLLLEAVALTTNPQTQITLVEKGLLQALQMCVQRLGGADASADHVPILRKVVKIIDAVAVNSPSVVIQRLRDTRTARGSLAQAIADLRAAKDPGLRKLASSLVDKLPADFVAPAETRNGQGAPMGRSASLAEFDFAASGAGGAGVASGAMAEYVLTKIVPQVPEKLRDPLVKAVEGGAFKSMMNKTMPAQPSTEARASGGIVRKIASRSQVGFVPMNPGKVNQDSFIAHSDFDGDPSQYYFGVMDGHGQFGHDVSGMLKRKLGMIPADP